MSCERIKSNCDLIIMKSPDAKISVFKILNSTAFSKHHYHQTYSMPGFSKIFLIHLPEHTQIVFHGRADYCQSGDILLNPQETATYEPILLCGFARSTYSGYISYI